jgi:hypothetical protein
MPRALGGNWSPAPQTALKTFGSRMARPELSEEGRPINGRDVGSIGLQVLARSEMEGVRPNSITMRSVSAASCPQAVRARGPRGLVSGRPDDHFDHAAPSSGLPFSCSGRNLMSAGCGGSKRMPPATAGLVPTIRQACEQVHVAPTTNATPRELLLRSVHWDGMPQPHQKSTWSSSQERNTPQLRGRRAPQARKGPTALTKGMRRGRPSFSTTSRRDFATLSMKTGSAVTSGWRLSGGPRRLTKHPSESC